MASWYNQPADFPLLPVLYAACLLLTFTLVSVGARRSLARWRGGGSLALSFSHSERQEGELSTQPVISCLLPPSHLIPVIFWTRCCFSFLWRRAVAVLNKKLVH